MVRTVPSSGLILANGQEDSVASTLSRGCWSPVEWLSHLDGWQAGVPNGEGHFDVYLKGERQGRVKWDLGRPYFIRHDTAGSCHHLDGGTHGCTIYADRPRVCQRYSCAGDSRIWTDFDGMELNHAWIDAHLGPDSPTLVKAPMQGGSAIKTEHG